ncbi:Crp/Fnr family transcriptional regulator [Glycomyces salinus]|uniref:Crp/Fnr family transcriptional regulator n=1 Tax=Glycomyces salinus TaxID=980294 RepID=UPI0018ECB142|nr:Crp/Fnr family transcriptional regulator [Glycomyces salinus]
MIAPTQWQDLVRRGRRRSFPAGGHLLDQGARGEVVYALLAGRVRVVYTESDGNEVLVAIRGPGDLLGEYAQQDHGTHMASVWALEDCETSALAGEKFESALEHRGLTEPLRRYMLAKARQVGERVWRAANLNTEQRMAQLFLEVLSAASAPDASRVPMTQQQVADSLGVSRSSVTRLLAHWRRSGTVRIGQSRIELLDRSALARRATGS